MGKNSKRRGGKSKRGGKHSPSDRTAEIITPLSSMSLAEEGGSNKSFDAMRHFEEAMELLRKGRKREQALELKARRDAFDLAMMANPDDVKDFDEVDFACGQLALAKLTVMIAKCGLAEDEKHSSIVYVEKHADKVFSDGGEAFFNEWKDATDKAKLEQKRRNEIKQMIKDGDLLGQMRILQDLMSKMDKAQNDLRIEQGKPPIREDERDNPLHLTILDDELFQPRPPRSDCPICFLQLPERNECCYQPCCGKILCDGCIFAHRDAKDELGVENCCPFCRDPAATTDTERLKKSEERLKHGDCEAYYMLGTCYLEGVPPNSELPPFKKNHKKGLELLNQAAELGSEAAHHALGMVHAFGQKGVRKDEKKGLYHLRLAAIGGMLQSRNFFGDAYLRESPKLAYKHFIIAAEAGYDESLKKVKTGYAEGHVEKDVFENVNRAHKAAKNEVKSEARDKQLSGIVAKVQVRNSGSGSGIIDNSFDGRELHCGEGFYYGIPWKVSVVFGIQK